MLFIVCRPCSSIVVIVIHRCYSLLFLSLLFVIAIHLTGDGYSSLLVVSVIVVMPVVGTLVIVILVIVVVANVVIVGILVCLFLLSLLPLLFCCYRYRDIVCCHGYYYC